MYCCTAFNFFVSHFHSRKLWEPFLQCAGVRSLLKAISNLIFTFFISERVPKAVFWDSTEPKLFTCETVVDPSNRRSAKPISVGRNYQGRKEVKAEEKVVRNFQIVFSVLFILMLKNIYFRPAEG